MRILLAGVLISLSINAFAQSEYSTQKERFSYALGYQIGQSLQRDDLDLDNKALVQAVEDVLNGAEPKVSAADMQAAVDVERQKRVDAQKAVADANKQRGDTFLAKNKSEEGIKSTGSGLQYKIEKQGEGATPTPQSTVVVHYRGTLLDGTEFDSSYARGQPATLPLNGVIKGWQEGLQLMSAGSKYRFFIPSELAYGARGAGSKIGPNETLIFDVELLEIK